MRRACAAAVGLALLLWAPAFARAATTIDFETPGPGTTLTNQYADVGGPGQGVVFGQLPGGQDGFRPVIDNVGMGTANSGVQAAGIYYCVGVGNGCEEYTPRTTGTFQVPRSKVSVDVGYEGTSGASCTVKNRATAGQCAYVTLTAVDSDGNPVGTPSSAWVTQGKGIHTQLSVEVPTASIVGFLIQPRTDSRDNNKQIAIDDLSFDFPPTPPPPDFTVTPSSTFLVMGQGEPLADPISIGRLSGSSGPVQLSLSGDLPNGVTASFDPNPATGNQSTLTFTTAPDSDITGFNPITLTVTGTPADPAAGDRPHSATISLQVRSEFDLRPPPQTDIDLTGCTVDVPFEVDRAASFPGPVTLSVSGMSGGVQASFAPAQATFPHGSFAQTIPLTIRAPADGMAVPPQTLVVRASAPPLADRTATLTVHGACPEQYDARVTSMQITQGVQSDFLPALDPARHPPNQYSYTFVPNAAKLRGGGSTVVRVYADESFGPATGLPAVPALLYGASYDGLGQLHALPGSPILPVNPPRLLSPGPATTTTGEEQSETKAYSFVLPPSWTHGEIAVNAILQPTSGLTTHTLTPCTTDQCKLDDSFGITHIPFTEGSTIAIRPVALTVSGKPALPDPDSVFAFARVVTPLDLAVQPYGGTIDITDLSDRLASCRTAAGTDKQKKSQCSDDANDGAATRLDGFTCSHGSPSGGWNLGVNTGVARGVTKTTGCDSDQRNAVVEVNRPLTSVTHEFFHLLGRKHASPACGGGSNGQSAEDWPPDELGYIGGVGLDTAMGSGVAGGPFAVIAGPPPILGLCADAGDCDASTPQQRFDLMSYCAFDHPDPIGNGSAWVSIHNWNAVLDAHRASKVVPRVRARANGPPALRVGAFLAPDGTVRIGSVTPIAAGSQAASSSPYHLVGTDAAGAVVADVPVTEDAMHVDGEQPPVPLTGVIPSAGVTQVAIVMNGVTLASRRRSANAPTVKVTGTPRFRKAGAVVRWKAVDADGDPLEATVDYSSDGGKSFESIFIGPNKGSAAVPARYLSRASAARVRVTVNDGFQAASATSKRFHSPGAPPDVRILSPKSGMRQRQDAPLVLSGQAFDDRGRMLKGTQLHWRSGKRTLGSGRSIAATGLERGRRTITLVARDRFGRTGRRSIRVEIAGARPIFLVLKAPKSVKHTARSLRLRVASSLPARLHVRGRSFRVARKTRSVKVRVARGRSRLTLRLRLTSGRLATTRTLVVRRR